MLKKLIQFSFVFIGSIYFYSAIAQSLSVEEMKFLTHQWEGERFEDGRPKVTTDVLIRMKKVSIEEAWGVLRNEGYHNQFDGDRKSVV